MIDTLLDTIAFLCISVPLVLVAGAVLSNVIFRDGEED